MVPKGSGLEKFCGLVWGPKRAKKAKKWNFPVWGAVLGETPADQICLHAECGPSDPCLRSHVPLGSEIRAQWGGGRGGHVVGWGRFLAVRDPTVKTNPDPKKVGKSLQFFFLVVVSKNVFSSETERFFSFPALGATYRGRAQ